MSQKRIVPLYLSKTYSWKVHRGGGGWRRGDILTLPPPPPPRGRGDILTLRPCFSRLIEIVVILNYHSFSISLTNLNEDLLLKTAKEGITYRYRNQLTVLCCK